MNDNKSKTQNPKFSLLSYNTHLFGGMFMFPEKYKDKERREEMIARILKMQKDLDIVCFTEIWCDKYKNYFIEKLKSPYKYYFYQKTPFYSAGSGLLIVSKFPLKKCKYFPFKNLSGADWMSKKGFYCVVCELNKKESFKLILTHTQAEAKEISIKNRFLNLKQIVDEAKNYEKSIKRTVICGDFNIEYYEKNDKEYSHVWSKLFSDNYVDTYSKKEWVYTMNQQKNTLHKYFVHYDPKELPKKLDFIIFNKGGFEVKEKKIIYDWKLDNKDKDDCSDHYPIFSTLQFL